MKYAAHLYRERGALVEAVRLTGTPPDGTNVGEVFAWMREGRTPFKGQPVERVERERERRRAVRDLYRLWFDHDPTDVEADRLDESLQQALAQTFPRVEHTAGDDVVIRFHSTDHTRNARVGDWVVKHRNYVFSAVSDDEFEAMYEVVE